MKIFRAFYGSLWIQMILNSALYWVLFANQINDSEAKHAEGFKGVILIFLPTILMSLDYALMYLALDDMQKRSRVQGGVAFFKKEQHEKLEKIMFIVTFTYVGIFIGVQVLIIILTIFKLVEAQAFLVELIVLIAFLMLFLNVFALAGYCRNAGNPYLNDRNKKYVRKFKVLLVVWNFAFIIKFFMTSFGTTILDIGESGDSDNDFWYSLETFVNIMFTEIIPFYFVLDKKIIKIFTMRFLDQNLNSSQGNNDQMIEVSQSPDGSPPLSLNSSVDLSAEKG